MSTKNYNRSIVGEDVDKGSVALFMAYGAPGGRKIDTLLVFEFPRSLDALYLQFLFISVLFALNDGIIRWLFGLVSNIDGRINEVNRRRARLVLGWVTVGR